MISEGDEALGDLVNVVLHESVHVTYYLSGQAYFNESIASFVAEKLTPEYLTRYQGPESGELRAYLKAEEEGNQREQVLYRGYQDLKKVYASDLSPEKKLEEKARIFTELKAKSGIKREINNASLIQFRTYGVGRPEYETLFRACGKDWGRFWGAIRKITEKSFSKSHEENLAPVLLPIAREGCGGA
jgi:predicted aminopeptidase